MFQNRRDAGRALANRLSDYKGRNDTVIVALPRGGVPVGYEVARALDAPLDVFIVRKLGAPGNEELAIGAIGSGGAKALNASLINALGISQSTIRKIEEREFLELARREKLYRGGLAPLSVTGKTVIVVDDGLATGASMKAALTGIRSLGADEVIAAAPVASSRTCHEIEHEFRAVPCICAIEPEPFYGVGMWYYDFGQVDDEEVRTLLSRRREEILQAGRALHAANL